jgi:hypothetical protein
MRLRQAGLNPDEIETMLRTEAGFGRSPRERLSQIASIMSSLRRYSVSVS